MNGLLAKASDPTPSQACVKTREGVEAIITHLSRWRYGEGMVQTTHGFQPAALALAPCSAEMGSSDERIDELFYMGTARYGKRICANACEPCFLKHAN